MAEMIFERKLQQDTHSNGVRQRKAILRDNRGEVAQVGSGARYVLQMKASLQINDDNGLEHEADVMGARAKEGRPQQTMNAKVRPHMEGGLMQLRAEMLRNNPLHHRAFTVNFTGTNHGLTIPYIQQLIHRTAQAHFNQQYGYGILIPGWTHGGAIRFWIRWMGHMPVANVNHAGPFGINVLAQL